MTCKAVGKSESLITSDDFYHANDEGGLAWNDPAIGIKWPEVAGQYNGTASAVGMPWQMELL